MSEPNSYFIKLTGKANIPEPLELGAGYKVLLDGEVVKEEKNNNQNGTHDLVYKFLPALCEIEKEYGKVIKAKDMRSRSSQLRRALYRHWEADPHGGLDSDESYDRVMKYILLNLGEIYESSKNYK